MSLIFVLFHRPSFTQNVQNKWDQQLHTSLNHINVSRGQSWALSGNLSVHNSSSLMTEDSDVREKKKKLQCFMCAGFRSTKHQVKKKKKKKKAHHTHTVSQANKYVRENSYVTEDRGADFLRLFRLRSNQCQWVFGFLFFAATRKVTAPALGVCPSRWNPINISVVFSSVLKRRE